MAPLPPDPPRGSRPQAASLVFGCGHGEVEMSQTLMPLPGDEHLYHTVVTESEVTLLSVRRVLRLLCTQLHRVNAVNAALSD